MPKINTEALAKKTEEKATCVANFILNIAGFGEIAMDESKMVHPLSNAYQSTLRIANKATIEILKKDQRGMICRGYIDVMTDFDGQLVPFYFFNKISCYDLKGEASIFRNVDFSNLENECK